jgi:hypothetical protein
MARIFTSYRRDEADDVAMVAIGLPDERVARMI